jgi:serine/threonine protein kinase
MVYEWLCGEPPFRGNQYQLAYQHKNVPPPSLCEKIPIITPDVEQVVMKALAKKLEERYASVQEFALALERAIKTKQRHERPDNALIMSLLAYKYPEAYKYLDEVRNRLVH